MGKDFKPKGYHSKSEMRRIEAMKEHERDNLRELVLKKELKAAQAKHCAVCGAGFFSTPDRYVQSYASVQAERDQLREENAALRKNEMGALAEITALEKERDALKEKLAVAVEALKDTEGLISGMAMTCLPINVREPDGSISQVRPNTKAGLAYDKIQETLKRIESGEG